MANFPYNTTGFVISFPPATASAALDITSFFNEADNAPFSSSLLNINGINIQLYRGGLPLPSNTPNTVYISTVGSLSGTLPRIALAFNASSSVAPYNSFWSDIVASDNGIETLFLGATNNGPQGNNYYYTSNETGTIYFTGGKTDTASGKFAGFIPITSSITIDSLQDYNGTELAIGSGLNINNINKMYTQYFTSITIKKGSLLLYPLSTITPQI